MDKNINRANNCNMLNSVKACLTFNNGIIESMPGLNTATIRYYGILDSINSKLIIINGTTAGITRDKNKARTLMQNDAIKIADRIMGYAGATGNNTLSQSMSQCIKGIEKASQSVAVSRCNVIKQAAIDNLEQLAGWNVSTEEINAFNNCIITFSALLNKQTNITHIISVAKEEADQLIKKAKLFLTSTIDKGVRSFIGIKPTFVAEYKKSRRIINLGHRHTQFKGIAISKETQQHLSNVQIEFRNHTGSVKVSSDQTGKYREVLSPDVYDMIATHPDFQPFIIEGIKILPGEIKIENIEMIPLSNS